MMLVKINKYFKNDRQSHKESKSKKKILNTKNSLYAIPIPPDPEINYKSTLQIYFSQL